MKTVLTITVIVLFLCIFLNINKDTNIYIKDQEYTVDESYLLGTWKTENNDDTERWGFEKVNGKNIFYGYVYPGIIAFETCTWSLNKGVLYLSCEDGYNMYFDIVAKNTAGDRLYLSNKHNKSISSSVELRRMANIKK